GAPRYPRSFPTRRSSDLLLRRLPRPVRTRPRPASWMAVAVPAHHGDVDPVTGSARDRGSSAYVTWLSGSVLPRRATQRPLPPSRPTPSPGVTTSPTHSPSGSRTRTPGWSWPPTTTTHRSVWLE